MNALLDAKDALAKYIEKLKGPAAQAGNQIVNQVSSTINSLPQNTQRYVQQNFNPQTLVNTGKQFWEGLGSAPGTPDPYSTGTHKVSGFGTGRTYNVPNETPYSFGQTLAGAAPGMTGIAAGLKGLTGVTGMVVRTLPNLSRFGAEMQGYNAMGDTAKQVAKAQGASPAQQEAVGMITPLIVGGIKPLEPTFGKRAVGVVRKSFDKDVRSLIGTFSQYVENNKSIPRQLSEYAYSAGETIFGKQAQFLTPKQLKNALDLVMKEADRTGGFPLTASIGLTTKNVRNGLKPEATEDVLNTIREALMSGDNEAAKALHGDYSKQFQLPKLEQLQKEIGTVQDNIVKSVQSEAAQTKFGNYRDIATKMRNFISMAGENQSKEGLRFGEHIPRRIFGMGSDEVATALGMDENAFMNQLAKEAKLVSEGKASYAIQKSFGDKVQKIKSMYDKLNPQFYQTVKDSLGKVQTVTAEATPQTLTKIAGREEVANLKTQTQLFDDWANSYRSETISPTEALNKGLKALRQATNTGVQERLQQTAQKVIGASLRSPEYVFEKLGLKKEIWEPLRKGEEAVSGELQSYTKMANSWFKDLKGIKDARARVFDYLDGQPVELSQPELKVANEVRSYLQQWAQKLNLPPEKRITDYITHVFDPELKVGKENIPPELYRALEFVKGKVAENPYLKERTGAEGYKHDLFDALDAYVFKSSQKLHLDGPVNNANAYIGNLPDSANRYLDSFMKNFLNKPGNMERWIDDNLMTMLPDKWLSKIGPKPFRKVANEISGSIYRGVLGFNVSSSLKNLTQGINTFSELGGKNTMQGYLQLLTKGTKELVDNNVLDDMVVAEYQNRGIRGYLATADKGLFYLFELAEKINRGAAYFGAKQKLLDQGLNEAAAIEGAKEIVRRTQFQYGKLGTPLMLQNPVGRMGFQLSTFALKQAEMLGGKIAKKDLPFIARYVFSSLALAYVNQKFLGDVLGIDYKDAFVKNVMPGFGPIPQLASEIGQAATAPDSERQYQNNKLAGKAFSMFVPAGAQMKKTFEGLSAVSRGGAFTASNRLRYPIKQSPQNYGLGAVFGQYALPEAKNYYNNQGTALSEKQTEQVMSAGNSSEAYTKAKEMAAINKESKANSEALKQQALQTHTYFKSLSSNEANQKLAQLKVSNPDLYAKVKAIALEEKKGLTPEDNNIQHLGILNGARAKYIHQQAMKLKTREERNAYVNQLRRKGIVTSKVLEQLKELAVGDK